VFKLGTSYSKPFEATYRDKNGNSKEIVMGCYGIGITRIATSAIELHHDSYGMIWPITIAPWHVVIVVANTRVQEQMNIGLTLYDGLQEAGVETVLDDRPERMGFKLGDADLIGYPYKLIVGNRVTEGCVELKDRKIGHRAIGVVYNPQFERNNYVPTLITDRYDAFLYFENTQALHPLRTNEVKTKEPNLYPFGL